MITHVSKPVVALRFLSLAVIGCLFLVIAGPARAQESADSTRSLTYRYFDRAIDPDRYLIRPQEKLTVSFVGMKLSPLGLSVNADGRLVDPTLGTFDLAGKTLTAARELLLPEIRRAYTADRIDITIGTPYQVAIAITGAVRKPGWYLGYTSNLASELIDLAGGVLPSGSRRHIELLGGPSPVAVDLDRAVYLGEWDANPPLYAGYRIHIPERSDRLMHVVGEVLQPREVELVDGDSVAQLVAMAGGLTEAGDRAGIHFSEHPNQAVSGSIQPQAGQVIVVPQRSAMAGSGSVAMFGAVAQPGKYPLNGATQLSVVLDKAGGVTGPGNRGRITVFRQARDRAIEGGQRVRFPISVGSDVAEFVLQPGDSVFVPLSVGFVRVEGRVRNPGLVPYSAGKNVGYYVQLAGGYLEDANREEIDITDRISRLTNRGGPDSSVNDGDQVVVRRKEIGR